MARTKHKVWRVGIGSYDDAGPANSFDDRVFTALLPTRKVYYIEGTRLVRKKALRLAESDGVTNPAYLGKEWINR